MSRELLLDPWGAIRRADILDSRDLIEVMEDLSDRADSVKDAVEELEENGFSVETDQNGMLLLEETIAAFSTEDAWGNPPRSDAPVAIDRLQGLDPLDEDETQLLAELQAIDDESPSDWLYGETFIAEDYFPKYAEEMADDIGAIDRNAGWPLTHIDWEKAADDLKQDYSEFTLAGLTFYARA
jgi:hypothetical protein